ncbi:MAG: pyridoxal-phosphate dependent enzyme [Acidobacteria bacterium]|nr:pyridoxal-phosphate dependent enzyme [Acidobacteriota bacterium]
MRDISLSAIEDAARAIYNPVVRTPLVRLTLPRAAADRAPDADIFLKLETLQPIGSFKIRGAQNVIRQLPDSALRDGVWTVSTGNAAQGVALAARLAGVACSVMVVDTAPATKIRSVEQLGAAVVRASYDECWRTVERHASDRMQGLFIHPFDDDRFIAGNGTAGLEILEDAPNVDVVIAPLGGGGLLAGVAAAIHARRPGVRVFAAEPDTASPFDTSLRNGRASSFDAWQPSFVDGAGGRSVLPTMWPLLSRLDGSIVVSLAEVKAAMTLVAERCHVIAEGAAGCAVAAALTGRVRGTVVAIVSGGNIDLEAFASLVGACKEK